MWFRYGGYLLIRRSRLAQNFGITNKWHPAMWVPHFLHISKELQVTQYIPTKQEKIKDLKRGVNLTLLYRCLTLWWFKGYVSYENELRKN
jgi:hypothetical protein